MQGAKYIGVRLAIISPIIYWLNVINYNNIINILLYVIISIVLFMGIILLFGKRVKEVLDSTAKFVGIAAGSTILYNNFGKRSDGNNDGDEDKNKKKKKRLDYKIN